MTTPREEGWHHDPESGRFRYWTGAGWDDEPAPVAATPVGAVAAPVSAGSTQYPMPPASAGPVAPGPSYASSNSAAAPPAASAPVPLRDVRGWVVGLIVTIGAVMWLGLGAVMALPMLLGGGLLAGGPLDDGWFTDGDPISGAPDGEPQAQADAVPLTDAVPGAWTAATSPSGLMTFAVDPAWQDLGSDDPSSFTGAPQEDLWELAGTWVTDDGGYLSITATHLYSYAWPLQEDAQWFMDPAGEYESTALEERAITTDAGYAGYEIVAQADDEGYTFEECVIVLDTGSSSIYLYATSEDPALACIDLVRPVAQSVAVS